MHPRTSGSILACALLACATPPFPQDASSTGLAVYLEARSPIGTIPARIDQVLFLRLDGEGDAALLSGEVFTSNYARDGYFYLLDPPPGHYVALGAVSTASGPAPPARAPTHHTGREDEPERGVTTLAPSPTSASFDYAIYFDEALVRGSEVVARPGAFGFMGEFTVATAFLRNPDPLQDHYLRLLQPEQSRYFFLQPAHRSTSLYGGSAAAAEQGDAARVRFTAKASEHLAGAGWDAMLSAAREESAPPRDIR
jgi:hypothetical protein